MTLASCWVLRGETRFPEPGKRLQSIFDGAPPRSIDDLERMQDHVTRLAKVVVKSTVSIQYRSAHGSGVIVSPEGYVLTVAHVVGQPDQIVQVHMADGQIVQGRSLGMHRDLDAGLIKLLDSGPWDYLPLSTNTRPANGLWCASVGHPGGFDKARGPVFRLGRVLGSDDLIRTDCQLVGGDSGGPLVDMRGHVIGIHSRIGANLSNNLHVPVATYRSHWKELIEGKLWRSQAFIGLRGAPDTESARVAFVHEGSPAEQAGIRQGDHIQRFNGISIEAFPQLVQLVRQHQPGDTIRLSVRRGSENLDFELTIGRRPSS